MAQTTSQVVSEFPYAADVHSLNRNTGRQVDWDSVEENWRDGSELVVVDGDVALDATSITVEELEIDVPAGQLLDFGSLTNVVVTLTALIAEGAVAAAVSALSGPIPAGTILGFGETADHTVTMNQADVAIGDEALTVEAIAQPLPVGELLNFGETDDHTVTVNQTGPTAAEGDTSVDVLATAEIIPHGTVLNFGDHTSGDIQMVVIVDGLHAAGVTTLVCQELSHEVEDGKTVVVPGTEMLARVATLAIATATSLVVEPLAAVILDNSTADVAGVANLVEVTTEAILGATALVIEEAAHDVASGATATFVGGSKLVKVTVDADIGDTTLTVDEIKQPVDDEDGAWVAGEGAKTIPAGTVMAELASGKVKPAADVVTAGGAETATSLIETNAVEGSKGDGLTGYGQIVGGAIYQNLLPDAAHASFATWITALEVNGVGTGWLWETYADDRA